MDDIKASQDINDSDYLTAEGYEQSQNETILNEDEKELDYKQKIEKADDLDDEQKHNFPENKTMVKASRPIKVFQV